MREELQSREQLDKEISMLEVASFMLHCRRLVLISAFGGILLALGFLLAGSSKYTATVSFTLQGGSDPSGTSSLSNLAQQFGVSIPRSGDPARSPQFYQTLITSREILDGLIESGIEVDDQNGSELISLYEYFDISGETTEELIARTRQLLIDQNVISTNFGRDNGVVTVSARTNDPRLSAGILRRVLDLVSEFDLETRQSQASAERRFAQERLVQVRQEFLTAEDSLKAFLNENRQFSNSPQLNFEYDRLERQVLMKQELVTGLAQAHEQARIDEVRNTPVITIINQPAPPVLPDSKGWLPTLLMGLIFGTIVGFALAFIRAYGKRAEAEDKLAYREFRELLTDARKNPFSSSLPR
jgi:uncharacterized protein involved in exopolysaccharide biosynthesis